MKIVLESQKEFLQGPSQVALTNTNQGQALNINMNFDALAEKLKEVGSSFQQMVGKVTGSIDSQGNMIGFAERGDFISGLLEGFGLDGLAGIYTNRKVEAEQEAAFVKNFEDENKELPVTKDTLKEIAKEAFRESKESVTNTTDTFMPGGQEDILEAEQREIKQISFVEDSTNYLMELTSEAKTYYPFIQEISKDMKELKDFILANGLGGGSTIIPGGLGGGGKPKPKPGAAGTAARALKGSAGVLAKLAVPLTVGLAGFNIFKNEQAVDTGELTREEATEENTKEVTGTVTGLAAAFGGAKAGAALGALTGPAAPIAMPVLGILGGFAAFFAGDKIGRAIVNDVYNSEDMDMLDPEASFVMGLESMAPVSSVAEVTQELQQTKREMQEGLDRFTANQAALEQNINNTINTTTTVINARKQVAPGNPDPTFLRFTDKNSAAR